ncbi:multiubiquitin domain-containing protein (plasmid) [Bradyrhizobium sp. 62B]|uniref:multiubiquitin domain-containing protein n=1 Tax=Bradyrhizobium sp. 62B TaxID=2898442 RepID=UPI002557D48B|nr:multiubiquitin domain-containing protein [Bradyrhizobium sp. 62B]
MENAVTGGESRDAGGAGQIEARTAGPDGQYFTTVNGETVKLANPDPKGGHILEKAGFNPSGDFALIQLLAHSSRLIGLDDEVDLRTAGTEVFRAFKTDRVYRFTLNGHGFEWGAAKLEENELRVIGHVAGDEVIVLERDGEDRVLEPADVVDLDHGGTEHLYTEKRLITVYYENEPREIPRGTYTTEELKNLFGVQEGYILEFINHEGQLTPLKPGAKLRVKEGMKFFEQVPCGGSS